MSAGHAPGSSRPLSWPLRLLAWVCLVLAVCATLLGLSAPWTLIGTLHVQWTVHAAILMIPAMVVWRRQARWCLPVVICLLLAIRPWVLAAWTPRAPRPEAAGRRVEVASFNINKANPLRAGDLPAVRVRSGGLLALIEIDRGDEESLRGDPRWPYQCWEHGARPGEEWRGFGVALLSPYPFGRVQIEDVGGDRLIDAEVLVDGDPLRVVVLHARSPMSEERWRLRGRQFDFLARLLRGAVGPLVVMGDFNCTVADPEWDRLLEGTRLVELSGRRPATWPSALGWAGIGIDHVLVGPGLEAEPARTVAISGSDHRGITSAIMMPGGAAR